MSIIDGTPGDDTLTGTSGNDAFHGCAGVDSAQFSAAGSSATFSVDSRAAKPSKFTAPPGGLAFSPDGLGSFTTLDCGKDPFHPPR